nr:MAG TPA: Herpesvirus UL33-like protein [Bacteriophage sp.]
MADPPFSMLPNILELMLPTTVLLIHRHNHL